VFNEEDRHLEISNVQIHIINDVNEVLSIEFDDEIAHKEEF
jgi:hypothetical protein